MIDSRSFRQLMSCFATGITVVTALRPDGAGAGITINSITSVSLAPPLILFCLDRKAHVFSIFKDSDIFAVNFLATGQEDLSRHFADYHHNPAPKNIWDKPQQGCPILKHTLGWMVCRKTATYKGGDHVILLGEVTKLRKRAGARDPLVYFHGRYRDLAD